jgi:hypothetical protein
VPSRSSSVVRKTPWRAKEVITALLSRSDPGMNPTARPMSRLAVLPGLTHYTVVNAPALWSAVESFLDEPEASRRG